MANLNSLFKKAAPSVETPSSEPDQELAAAATDGADSTPAQVVQPERKGLGFLGKSAAKPVSDSERPATAPAKPKLAGLGLGKIAAVPASNPAPSSDASNGSAADDEVGLIDLDSLMNMGDDSAQPTGRSTYPDEIGATDPIPERMIPEDATDAMRTFVGLLDSVYTIGHDPQLLGGVIRNIMIELQHNPAYINAGDWKKSLVQPDDVRVWMRNMRETMGLAKITKAEKKAKRGSSKKKEVESSEMLDDLASLGFSLEV